MHNVNALRYAVALHGLDAVRPTALYTDRDFITAWAHELAQMDERGECEIAGRYTATGNPVTVTGHAVV